LKISILAPDLAGGGMTRAYWIAQLAQALGHEVEIAGPLIREPRVYPEPPPELRVTAVAGGSLAALVERLAPPSAADVLIAIKPLRSSFGVALEARKGRRRPLILDIDDWEPELLGGALARPGEALRRALLDPLRALRGAAWRLRRTVGREQLFEGRRLLGLCGEADAVTVNSRALAARFGGTLLPSGKDTRRFDPRKFDADACRARLGLAEQRVLMFPGTPQPHKGLEDVLEALDRLARPELRLVLVGGRTTVYRESLRQRGARHLVELPRQPSAEMPAVVAAAHVVVVPQRDGEVSRAQFPMKLTDAMAMAKPILCTAVGDVPEVVGDAAWVVEPGRPDQLAEALGRILSDPDAAARRGERARQRCLERLSIDANAPLLAAVLERVRAQAGSGPASEP
jgi:glycosyltransferase involved in cell wall biosynthesis